jgi:phthiocerol/phenolphthiocerol synthesis type-I polyketide synthase E
MESTIVEQSLTSDNGLKKFPSIDDWFYQPRWVRRQIVSRDNSTAVMTQVVILRLNTLPKSLDSLLTDLRKSTDLTEVCIDASGALSVILSSGASGTFLTQNDMWAFLKAHGVRPQLIIHALSVTSDCLAELPSTLEQQLAYLERSKATSFYPLLAAVQSYATTYDSMQIRFVCLVNNTHRVHSRDLINPYKAMLTPCTKVIAQEIPAITTKHLEYVEEEYLTDGSVRAAVRDDLLLDYEDSVVAIRSDSRWVQTFERLRVSHVPTPSIELRCKGAYLITGGRGRIGYTLAHYLARTYQANLVLTGITEPVPPDHGDAIPTESQGEESAVSEIEKVRRLEEYGSTVRLVACDVSDSRATRKLIQEIDQEFGCLRGVIHAAGIFDSQRAFRGILETTIEDCERRFLPKVNGALILADALAGRPLDFCIMQSSLSAVLGGFGFLAYSAGNMFMDMFAESYRTDRTPWMSINWDGWVFRQNDSETKIRSVVSPKFASPDFGVVAEIAIRPSEGEVCLDKLLRQGTRQQTLVSTADLLQRVDQWVFRSILKQPLNHVTTHETDVDTIISIFEVVLGVEGVTSDSDYFALGGDSLTGIQLVSELSAEFGCTFDIISILENPTPLAIAQQLAAIRRENGRSLIDGIALI